MHDTSADRHLLLIIADGVRPDVMTSVIDSGDAPTLARLRSVGGCHTITSSFPSVTGPAYVPLLAGRHPGRGGIPGLRWFDRTGTIGGVLPAARSYAGFDIWKVDSDLDRNVPTLLELSRPSLAAMSMLARGASEGHIGRSIAWMVRGSIPHFLGLPRGWRQVERKATRSFLDHFARVRPRFSVLAITSSDKFAHRYGARHAEVRESILDMDRAAAEALAIAKRDGWQSRLNIWLAGDHGHAPVNAHDDLQLWLESLGVSVLAHPGIFTRNPHMALMVSGNAMAHLYLEPAQRIRRWWPQHRQQWGRLLELISSRESVDLVMTAESESVVTVASSSRGYARVVHHGSHDFQNERWSYEPVDHGDPLLLGGRLSALDASDAWLAASSSPYPDSLVQLTLLMHAPRSGDIVISARDGWDLRSRFEPIPHVSTHGALCAAHMQTPLLLDVEVSRQPQRTTDVAVSAMELLGIASVPQVEGRSFL